MSNHDDNVEVIFSDGGWVGYRAFVHDPAHKGACLRSLFADYHWRPGPLQADAVPDHNNTNGFYAHKSLPEAIYQSGREDGLIFALIEAWEVMIEGETGLRSEMAEIVAIVEPTRPKQIELFPWEDLARDYPNVPIVHQRDLRRIIAERGMVTLTRSRPSPPMQWLGQKSDLRWYREGLAPNGYVMLEAASTYPGELHPADQRLRKSYYQDLKGDRYVFWETVGQDGVSEIFLMVEMSPESMYLHLDPEQPDSESQEGE